MMNRLATLIAVGCLLIPCLSAASERSQVLSSRGLIEFHAARYPKALELFDQAVAADPTDMSARYFRAAVRARLGDYDGAIADLRAVLAGQPDFDQAALDLGVALIETKQYREALPWLIQAQGTAALDGRASLFIGIAHLRLGELESARESFRRAARDLEQSLAAHYYEGVTDYQEGNWSAAEQHFTSVIQTSPDSPMGREAAAFLAKLNAARRRQYQLYSALGFLYDSNVILASSTNGAAAESVLGVTQRSDVLATISAGGSVVPWRSDRTQLSIGYDFYQSLHKDLHEFDLQDHGPGAQITTGIGPVDLGLLGRYDYYFLDGGSFLQEATALPWATISAGNAGRSELYYRMVRRDYKKVTFIVRDDFNHAVGVRQFVYLGSPDRYVAVGYQFDDEDPVVSGRLDPEDQRTAQGFAYYGNEVNTGVGWVLPAQVSVEAGYAYRHERYTAESRQLIQLANGDLIPSGSPRRDNRHVVVIAARKQLWKNWSVGVGYAGIFNNSNESQFHYDRDIVSLVLEWRL